MQTLWRGGHSHYRHALPPSAAATTASPPPTPPSQSPPPPRGVAGQRPHSHPPRRRRRRRRRRRQVLAGVSCCSLVLTLFVSIAAGVNDLPSSFPRLSIEEVTTATTPSTVAANPPCNSDAACKAMAPSGTAASEQGYICVEGFCAAVVTAAAPCRRASDCLQYHLVQRALAANVSLATILGLTPETSAGETAAEYLDSICQPKHCTFASQCSSVSVNVLGSSNYNPYHLSNVSDDQQSCCLGAYDNQICKDFNDLTNCDTDSVCQRSDENSNSTDWGAFTCGQVNKKKTEWIGIVISLIGASFLNVGLNLQKLALRKRHEKVQRRRMQIRMMERIQAIREAAAARRRASGRVHRSASVSSRLSALFPSGRKGTSSAVGGSTRQGAGRASSSALVSGANDAESVQSSLDLPYQGSPSRRDRKSSAATASSSKSAEALEAAKTSAQPSRGRTAASRSFSVEPRRSKSAFNFQRASASIPHTPQIRVIADETMESAVMTREDGTTEDIHIPVPEAERAEHQKSLDFKTLVKNPIWILGFTIFLLSNLLNFIALNFAPQSLIAPLGSISLVVNIFMAPLINHEKFTWKDIVGAVLIVGGSSMTVVFAGVSSQDYNLCVLLALFRRPATIVFLAATAFLITVVYCTIMFVEKNLDLPDQPSNETGVPTDPTGPSPSAIAESTAGGAEGPGTTAAKRSPLDRSDRIIVESATPAKPVAKGGWDWLKARRSSNPKAAFYQRNSTTDDPVLMSSSGENAMIEVPGTPALGTDSAVLPANRDAVLQWTYSMSSKVYLFQDALTKRTSWRIGRPRADSGLEARADDIDALATGIADGTTGNSSSPRITATETDEADTDPVAFPSQPSEDAASISTARGLGVLTEQGAIPLTGPGATTALSGPMIVIDSASRSSSHSSSAIEAAASRDREDAAASTAAGFLPVPGPTTSGRTAASPNQTREESGGDADGTSAAGRPEDTADLEKDVAAAGADARSLDATADVSKPSRQSLPPAVSAPDGPTRKKSMWEWMYGALPPTARNWVDAVAGIKLVPRLKKKIPVKSVAVQVVLPFSYASLGGLMATVTVLFAKSTIHLLSNSFITRENQFTNFAAWVITGVTVVTAVNQVYWINMGLQRYDALLQIPVFYVVWTLFDVIGGGIYFSEFDGFSSRQYGLFFLAVGIIFVGVIVLGDRLKKSQV